jgi:hypothetical protein
MTEMEATEQIMADATTKISYRLDASNRLIQVGPEWDRFALENGGESVLSERILGMRLSDFMRDAETLHLHERLLQRVRRERDIHGLSFRCDSPDRRRHMEMDIVNVEHGVVEYCCRIVRVEPREPILLNHAEHTPSSFLRMCSWCNRMNVEGAWMELEDAAARLHLFEKDRVEPISHAMCDECLDALYRDDETAG